ncbi:MAG: hypothetical protein M3385_02725 [Actinomycetota bacterium]|nr:hypothetical protein [Actinomycetota bacterium]
MGFILTAIGLLLLVVALAGIALGIYMAFEPKTRASGKLFAIWWVPGLAAASGVLMRDVVTFVVAIVCFLVAGAVIVLEDRSPRKVQVREKSGLARGTGGNSRLDSERTTKKNRTKDSDRAAS